jgi:hypothetical protein
LWLLVSTTKWWKEPLGEWCAKKRRPNDAPLQWKRMLQQQMQLQQRLFEQEKLNSEAGTTDSSSRSIVVAQSSPTPGGSVYDEADLSNGDFCYFFDVHNPRKLLSFEKELLLPHHKLINIENDGAATPTEYVLRASERASEWPLRLSDNTASMKRPICLGAHSMAEQVNRYSEHNNAYEKKPRYYNSKQYCWSGCWW